MPILAGIDGCPSGWYVVLAQLRRKRLVQVERRIVPRFEELLRPSIVGKSVPDVIAIDMPIGLPDAATPGGRPCDKAARELLGRGRAASVFSPPSRHAITCTDYRQAHRANRASSQHQIGLTRQTFNLFPKIREVDDALRKFASIRDRVHEVHPEVCFHAMAKAAGGVGAAGGAGAAGGSGGAGGGGGGGGLRPKKEREGQRDRLRLLINAGIDVPAEALRQVKSGVLNADDVIDAHACLWTARRLALGEARSVHEKIDRDSRRLRMAIWY
jgi:predicted RNase H-like nuclease